VKIIGFHWDHLSSVALLQGREITACVAEERFSGVKNDCCFPWHAANYCVELAGGVDAIDGVAIATLERTYELYLLKYYNNFTVADFVKEQHEYSKPWFFEGRRDIRRWNIFPDYVNRTQYPQDYWSVIGNDERRMNSFKTDAEVLVGKHFGLPPEKVRRFDHHSCHARYSLHASDFQDGPVLVLTVDGQGDGANATAFLGDGAGLRKMYSTPDCTLGRYYRFITLLLGMRPLEHEYKVMGLAPYGKGRDVDRVLSILQGTLTVDGIKFLPGPNKPLESYFSFRDLFEGIRMDHVAAGLQLWVELTLEQWIGNVVKHFDVDSVVVGGGVSMNVKAMGRIAQQPWIRRFFVAGSSSDESNAMGAALCLAAEQGTHLGKAVTSLYLGPPAGARDAILARARAEGHTVVLDPSDAVIVSLLLAGAVVGRCVGRMEFGQRALGNRSILADPINPEIIPRINAMIKNRDFWMPFAPVILDSCAGRYLKNHNGIDSPHMTIGFETTPEGYADLKAACHPADRTTRAQILRREQNPPLYGLLEEFQRRTGRGGLLNTSFNLHGSPIVRTVEQAYDVFVKSGMDAVLTDTLLIVKASSPTRDILSCQS